MTDSFNCSVDEFLGTVHTRVQTFDIKPKLYHVHFTLLNNVFKKKTEFDVHTIVLPPRTIQYQTVIKVSTTESLRNQVTKLIADQEEFGYTIIGKKIEALFNRVELINTLRSKLLTHTLPIFNYIEEHETYDRSKKYPPNTYVSYSCKHECIATATRHFEVTEDVITILEKSKKVNIEVSLIDCWKDVNIEEEWFKCMDVIKGDLYE